MMTAYDTLVGFGSLFRETAQALPWWQAYGIPIVCTVLLLALFFYLDDADEIPCLPAGGAGPIVVVEDENSKE